MKLKFLKQIQILGFNFKMEWNKKDDGGFVSFSELRIVVGTLNYDKSPVVTFDTLMHEISEAIHIILNTRYDDMSVRGNYKFFLDHKEFQNHNTILAETISKFIN